MQLEIIERINFKKFFSLSVAPTLIVIYLSNTQLEIGLNLLMYLATVIYVLMFSEAIFLLTSKYKENAKPVNNKYLAFLFVGKLLILVSAIIYSVQYLKSRIIISILNYIIHIFILGVSVKKK